MSFRMEGFRPGEALHFPQLRAVLPVTLGCCYSAKFAPTSTMRGARLCLSCVMTVHSGTMHLAIAASRPLHSLS